MAKARPKENMPNTGFTSSPPAEEIKMEPTIGPVHEKDTSTKVKAIKNTPPSPPFSAFASILFTKLEGRVSSNIPKKAKANTTNIPKKKTLGAQWVASQLANSGP